MKKISKENLTKDLKTGTYKTVLEINKQNIHISIDPDDVEIEKTIELSNKIIDNFSFYENSARQKIINDYLENYNENWRDEEEGVELDQNAFSNNLTLKSISFLSDSSIDFFYSENGMFGNHSLIAQSFDGENFDYTTMYG